MKITAPVTVDRPVLSLLSTWGGSIYILFAKTPTPSCPASLKSTAASGDVVPTPTAPNVAFSLWAFKPMPSRILSVPIATFPSVLTINFEVEKPASFTV